MERVLARHALSVAHFHLSSFSRLMTYILSICGLNFSVFSSMTDIQCVLLPNSLRSNHSHPPRFPFRPTSPVIKMKQQWLESSKVHTDATSCMALRKASNLFAHQERKSTERRSRLDLNMIRSSDDFAWRARAKLALWSFLCLFHCDFSSSPWQITLVLDLPFTVPGPGLTGSAHSFFFFFFFLSRFVIFHGMLDDMARPLSIYFLSLGFS